MRIMIVDDSRAMRLIVTRTLRQAGYGDSEIREAEDGRVALAAILADPPDLVLSDWNMPEMNGIDLLAELRARGNRTTFGFVTSESTPQMRERAEAAGAAFLIGKPFSAETFAEHLSAHV